MTRVSLSALCSPGRLVVVAAHPGDEVLAVGGLLSMATTERYEVEVVAVTDGEASHRGSTRITPAQMRELRERETAAAYAELGIRPPRYRLGIPDGGVDNSRDALRQLLAIRVSDAACVVGPLESDGAPDQRAVAETLRDVADSLGVRLWRFAVWGRKHPERLPDVAPCSLVLPAEVLARKQRALHAFSSQTSPLGPGSNDGPIYPPGFLSHFEQETEPLWPESRLEGL